MNNRYNTPSYNSAPRTFEDTFKTKKRESAKVISETVKDGVKYIVLESQPEPTYSPLKFNDGYMKTPYCMKEGMYRFKTAQRSHF
jgi:hypothetical protein